MTAGTLVGGTESAVLAAALSLPGTVTGGGEVDQGHVTEEKGGIGLALNPRREKLSIAAGEGGEWRETTSRLSTIVPSILLGLSSCGVFVCGWSFSQFFAGHPSIGTSLLVGLNTSHLCSSRQCKVS